MKAKLLVIWLLAMGSTQALGAAAPDSRGSVPVSVAMVTVCGLAAVLIVEAEGASAEIYYGSLMEEKLSYFHQQQRPISHVELAEIYLPVEASCDNVLRSQSDLTRQVTPANQ